LKKRWTVLIDSKPYDPYFIDNFWGKINQDNSHYDFIKFYFLYLIKGHFVIEEHEKQRIGGMEVIIMFGVMKIFAGVYLERVPVYKDGISVRSTVLINIGEKGLYVQTSLKIPSHN